MCKLKQKQGRRFFIYFSIQPINLKTLIIPKDFLIMIHAKRPFPWEFGNGLFGNSRKFD